MEFYHLEMLQGLEHDIEFLDRSASFLCIFFFFDNYLQYNLFSK